MGLHGCACTYVHIYSVNAIIGMGAIKSCCGDYMECVIFCVYA